MLSQVSRIALLRPKPIHDHSMPSTPHTVARHERQGPTVNNGNDGELDDISRDLFSRQDDSGSFLGYFARTPGVIAAQY